MGNHSRWPGLAGGTHQPAQRWQAQPARDDHHARARRGGREKRASMRNSASRAKKPSEKRCQLLHGTSPPPFSTSKAFGVAPPYGQILPGAEDRSAKDQWPESGRFRNGGDGVVIQGHGAGIRKGCAGHACPGIHGNAFVSENTAIKRRVCTESGGADLPKHVAGLSSTDQDNRRTAVGPEYAPKLENEARIAVVLRVQSEYSRQLSRRVEAIDAWRECEYTP